MLVPFTQEARSDRTKATTSATSSAVPSRPDGKLAPLELREAFALLLAEILPAAAGEHDRARADGVDPNVVGRELPRQRSRPGRSRRPSPPRTGPAGQVSTPKWTRLIPRSRRRAPENAAPPPESLARRGTDSGRTSAPSPRRWTPAAPVLTSRRRSPRARRRRPAWRLFRPRSARPRRAPSRRRPPRAPEPRARAPPPGRTPASPRSCHRSRHRPPRLPAGAQSPGQSRGFLLLPARSFR